ncbi:30S ribosomal protein S6 [Candidatus Giovannonibacteria bacterium]|nr:30S ribosomal protein S6 [Candidatus Giovannonibacteria bacterium]
MTQESKLYEISFFFESEADEDREKIASAIRKEIEDRKGMILEERISSRKLRLGYLIQKKREAFLGCFKFLLLPLEIASLKNSLQNAQILRFEIVKSAKTEPERSASARKIKKTAETPANPEEIDKKLEEILGK